MRNVAALILPAALAACSFGQGAAAANQSVERFHGMLNAGQFAQIYAASSPKMQRNGSVQDFVRFLTAVRTKLGPFASGDSVGWNERITSGGHSVNVTYRSTYRRGQAQETFVFGLGGDSPKLIGYHVSSPALILN